MRELKIPNELKAYMTRRQWARLWGKKHMIRPVFIEQFLGDGRRLVGISPLNTRPNYYLIRIDSGWSLDNCARGPVLIDHLEEIQDAIEEQVGPRIYEDDDGKEVVEDWPALNDEAGIAWWDAMHLLAARKLSEG